MEGGALPDKAWVVEGGEARREALSDESWPERERDLYFPPARLGCEHMVVIAWTTCRSVYWTVYLCWPAVAIQSMVQ